MNATTAQPTKTIIAAPGQSVTFELAHATLIVRVTAVGKLFKLDYETVKRIPQLTRDQEN